MIIQDQTRTLEEPEITETMNNIVAALNRIQRILEGLNMALTKAEMAEHLSTHLGINKKHAKGMVEAFFEEIRETLNLVSKLNYQVLETLI